MQSIPSRSCLISAGILALVGAASPAKAGFVHFNTPGDLAANFFGASSSGTTADNYAEAAGVGIGSPATRGLDTIGTGAGYTTLIYNQESFSLANVGDTVVVSAMAKRQDDTNPTNLSSAFLRVGVTDATGSAVNRITGGSGNAVALEAFPTTGAPATDVTFKMINKVGTLDYTLIPTATTLTSGNWYRLTATFTNAGSGNISIAGLLEDLGTNGIDSPNEVRSLAAQNFANAGLAADSQVYGALLARQDGGSNSVDNFSVTVPEPTSLGVLAGAGLLLRRRRPVVRSCQYFANA